MIEEHGNFWELKANARCITTNGALRKNGNAVMGAGLALQARERCRIKNYNLEDVLGKMIRNYGNHVFYLGHNLFSFPTKHNWRNKYSDPVLIERSTNELVRLTDNFPNYRRILMTRPGCGNGELLWQDVKKIIQDILDDRFVIVDNTYEGYITTFKKY